MVPFYSVIPGILHTELSRREEDLVSWATLKVNNQECERQLVFHSSALLLLVVTTSKGATLRAFTAAGMSIYVQNISFLQWNDVQKHFPDAKHTVSDVASQLDTLIHT